MKRVYDWRQGDWMYPSNHRVTGKSSDQRKVLTENAQRRLLRAHRRL
jgi:hypothetical protein